MGNQLGLLQNREAVDASIPEGLAPVCPICMDTFRNAETTLCGHSFCSTCIRQSLAHCPACPVCRQPLSTESLLSDDTLNGFVRHLCESAPESDTADATPTPHTYRGEAVTLANPPPPCLVCRVCGGLLDSPVLLACCRHAVCSGCVSAHDSSCKQHPSLGHWYNFGRDHRHTHAVRDCVESLSIICPLSGCTNHMPLARRDAHKNECPSQPVPCPVGGPSCPPILRGDLPLHVESCPNARCPHRPCMFKGTPSELRNHLVDQVYGHMLDVHLALERAMRVQQATVCLFLAAAIGLVLAAVFFVLIPWAAEGRADIEPLALQAQVLALAQRMAHLEAALRAAGSNFTDNPPLAAGREAIFSSSVISQSSPSLLWTFFNLPLQMTVYLWSIPFTTITWMLSTALQLTVTGAWLVVFLWCYYQLSVGQFGRQLEQYGREAWAWAYRHSAHITRGQST